jgi:hypothetical protein
MPRAYERRLDSDTMALLECRDCKGTVSSEAVACPHCGRPVRPASVEQSRQRSEGCFLSTLNSGCLLLFILIVTTMVVWPLFQWFNRTFH